ncbi:hypothetical protein BJ944DRAFT_230440 [Cunninghamella echinulata]|nr:hypothetical protein BJ944DRAFT_230440 [Cunninghamella echinulata]
MTQEDNKTDIVFASSETNLRANKIIFSANNHQLTPLAKARWLVYLSAFFDKEALGLETFDKISQEYNCHKSNVASLQQGAILVTPSIPLEFHKDIHQAEIVIDQTNLAKDFSNGDADYEDWLEKGEFVPDTVSFNQPFIHKNNVFRLDGFVDEKGFEDWTQRSAARPDLALTEYNYVWLRNFAKGDHARVITKDNYVCENLLVMNNCQPRNGNDSNKHTYGKNNVGIIIGLLASAGLIAGAVVYYRNRKRQQNIEYFPLNDF